MKNINILIVEDTETHIEGWKQAIAQFNMFSKKHNKDLCFFAQFAKTYGEATEKLRTFHFSAAIIDIRLAEDNGEPNEDNTKGNEVLLDIVNSTMCLAWVYTGQQADAEIPQYLTDYIEVIDRSELAKGKILEQLESKLDVIESIIKIKSKFSKSKAEHFYSAIWPRWSLWLESSSIDPDGAIIRHMATHLHASFLNETEKVHPEEYYFTGPMIKGALDTGDITLVDDKHFILVTPRCEIAQDKNLYYQFVELEDKSEEMQIKIAELDLIKEDVKQKKIAIKEHKKCLRDLDQQKRVTTKTKNIEKTKIHQAIGAKSKVEGSHIVELNSKISAYVESLFELESNEKHVISDISDKEKELNDAMIELKKSEKKEQSQINGIKALLPSSGGKISQHILPEVKQPSSVTYGPLHAQFEKITYITKGDQAEVERYKQGKYARLSNEFISSFVERLGSHFSRIGTPDYSHPD